MKIINIVTQMERGGAQAMALRLAHGFRDRGLDAETWFLYEKSAAFGSEPGVRTVVAERPRSLVQLGRTVAELRRMLMEARPDVVIGFTHYANVIGAAAGSATGVQAFVATQHNAPSTYPTVARLADFVAGSLGLYALNIHCGPSVLSAFGTYPRRYLERSKVVANGVQLTRSALTRADAKARFGVPADTPLLVAIGRLSPQKNHAVLLRVLREIPSAHLVIAGEGELRAELEQTARELGVAERLRMPGEMEKADVADLLRAADLYVMPSLFEGMSVALIEAMQEGAAILSSDAPAQVDVLTCEDGQVAGRTVSPHDAAGWVDAAADLLGDAGERRRLGALAERRARAFDLDTMVDTYLAEINAVLRGRRAA